MSLAARVTKLERRLDRAERIIAQLEEVSFRGDEPSKRANISEESTLPSITQPTPLRAVARQCGMLSRDMRRVLERAGHRVAADGAEYDSHRADGSVRTQRYLVVYPLEVRLERLSKRRPEK